MSPAKDLPSCAHRPPSAVAPYSKRKRRSAMAIMSLFLSSVRHSIDLPFNCVPPGLVLLRFSSQT
eukprot:2261799-Prymnesium_polylepis.1